MKEYIEEFKAEATSITEQVQQYLLLLENDIKNENLVNEIFRGVHTLKGSARMFGFDSIEHLTHNLENILDEVRNGERPLNKIIINLSLEAMDLVSQILKEKAGIIDVKSLTHKIDHFQKEPIEAIVQKTFSIYQVLYFPNENVLERGIKPMAVVDEMNQLGELQTFHIYEDTAKIKSDSFTSKYEFIIKLNKPYEELEDVFIFMGPDEFKISELKNTSYEEATERIYNILPGSEKVDEKLLEEREIYYKALWKIEKDNQAIKIEQDGNKVIKQDINSDSHSSSVNYINVKLDRLDEMMNLVSEVVTIKAELVHQSNIIQNPHLVNIVERLDKITSKFRDNAFNMRLVPLQVLSLKFQRSIRELGDNLGKEINLLTDGLDTEIDKSIINEVEAPLMHIIRNALDHGLETPEERESVGKSRKGLLKIVAFYAGANVFIQVQDDGRGLNLKRIKEKAITKGLISKDQKMSEKEIIDLIFEPGFSTHDEATEYSGRGVGMDVVKNKIRSLRGSIEVTTEDGLGTAFTLRLPLSLSILDVLHVKVGDINYLIPHNEIEQCCSERLNPDQIRKKGYNLKYKGKLLPHFNLMELFAEKNAHVQGEPSIIIVNKNDQYISLEVDEIIGEEQLVIKPVDEALKNLSYLAGISVLGNGELAFLIDSLKLKDKFSKKHAERKVSVSGG